MEKLQETPPAGPVKNDTMRKLRFLISAGVLIGLLMLFLRYIAGKVNNITPESAGLAFTGVTVELGISLTIVDRAWNRLQSVMATFSNRSEIIFGKQHFEAADDRYRSSLARFLVWGIILLSFSIFMNLLAIVGLGGIMLSVDAGPFTEDNYKWSVASAEVSSGAFVSGMLFVCGIYYSEALRYLAGRSSAFYGIAEQSKNVAEDNSDKDILPDSGDSSDPPATE